MIEDYSLPLNASLRERFQANPLAKLAWKTPLTPTNMAPVVTDRGGFSISLMRWGLRPQWAARKNSPFMKPFVESRQILEEVDKNKHRDRQVTYNRCLVPAIAPDGELYGMAGIYEAWENEAGKDMSSFALITGKSANPIRIAQGVEGRWLDPNFQDWTVLTSFLRS